MISEAIEGSVNRKMDLNFGPFLGDWVRGPLLQDRAARLIGEDHDLEFVTPKTISKELRELACG